MVWMQASTRPRKSSPRPTRRSSYQSYAALTSCSASGAITSLTAMTASHAPLHLLPAQPCCRIVLEVRLSPREFFFLPLVDRDSLRGGGDVIPKVFDELELLGQREVENRGNLGRHSFSTFFGKRPVGFCSHDPPHLFKRQARFERPRSK